MNAAQSVVAKKKTPPPFMEPLPVPLPPPPQPSRSLKLQEPFRSQYTLVTSKHVVTGRDMSCANGAGLFCVFPLPECLLHETETAVCNLGCKPWIAGRGEPADEDGRGINIAFLKLSHYFGELSRNLWKWWGLPPKIAEVEINWWSFSIEKPPSTSSRPCPSFRYIINHGRMFLFEVFISLGDCQSVKFNCDGGDSDPEIPLEYGECLFALYSGRAEVKQTPSESSECVFLTMRQAI